MLSVFILALAPTPAIQIVDFIGYSRPVISEYIPRQYRRIVRAASLASDIPVRNLAKFICSESSWRDWMIAGPNADGSYDYGIAGWNNRYLLYHWEKLGKFNPFSPEESIIAAARWLRILKDEFGTLELAVTAYKAGPGRTARGTAPAWVREIAREVAR